MKAPSKRSLNKCRDIWVVEIDYQKHSLAVSKYLSILFSVWAQVNEQWAHILINTDMIRNFMSSTFIKKVKI